MARPRGRPGRRTTAALLVLLFVSCLVALCAATTDTGHHARTHPVAHVAKDVGKFLVGSGVRSGGDVGGWPAVAPFAATALAVLVLAAFRYGRAEPGCEQCDTTATPSRGPPGRPVLA